MKMLLNGRFEFPEVLNDDGDFLGFDIIIGNPPYGVSFNAIEKSFYRSAYSIVHLRTPESYNYFILLFSNIAKTNAMCNLIIPSSILSQIEFKKTRELLLTSFTLYLDINLGDSVFDDVSTPTCIVGFKKSLMGNRLLYSDLSSTVRSELSKNLNSVSDYIDKDLLIENGYSLIKGENKSLIKKCFENKPTLRNIAEDVATGISPGLGDAFVININTVGFESFEPSIIKKLIVGGEINRYYLKPESQKSIIYFNSQTDINKYPNVLKHLNNYKVALENRVETKSGTIPYFVMLRPRREKLFTEPKILIRQTANKIMAAYDSEQWYCLKSGIIIQIPKDSSINYYYLLGLLNSSLMDFIYRDLVNEDIRVFPEVKPIQLFKLPIAIPNKEITSRISKLVIEIIEEKKKTRLKDKTPYEVEIDQLVYQLYELTPEEIKIIENA